MAASNPDGYTVDPRPSATGRELQRPECILAEPDGTLWAADGAAASPASRPTARKDRPARGRLATAPATPALPCRPAISQGTLPNWPSPPTAAS